jgi:uncharacterized repeat protein (TIGR01451 family)
MYHICLVITLLIGGAQLLSAQTSHRLMRDGDKAYKAGDYAIAEEAYRKSLSEEQKPQAVYNLGNSLFQQERYDEAINKFQQVVETSDDEALRADAFHNLGNTFFALEDYRNSIAAFKDALRLRPDDPSTRYNLAQAQHVFAKVAKFDLALKMALAEQPEGEKVKVGDTRTYNITIVNEGEIPAKGVGIIDYLPKGMKVNDPNWVTIGEGFAQYRLGIPSIPVEDSVTVAVRLVVEDASEPEALFNAAEISQASNRYDKEDIDSTPANAAENPQEDDFASDNPSQQQQQQQPQQDGANEDQQQEQQDPSEQQGEQDKQQDQPQDQQNQQDQQPPNPQQQQPQQGEKQELSPEEAMRLLKIIEEEELQVMEKLKKAKGNTTKRDKDW